MGMENTDVVAVAAVVSNEAMEAIRIKVFISDEDEAATEVQQKKVINGVEAELPIDSHISGNHGSGAGKIPVPTAPSPTEVSAGAMESEAVIPPSTVAEAAAKYEMAISQKVGVKPLAKQIDELQNAMKRIEMARKFDAQLQQSVRTLPKPRTWKDMFLDGMGLSPAGNDSDGRDSAQECIGEVWQGNAKERQQLKGWKDNRRIFLDELQERQLVYRERTGRLPTCHLRGNLNKEPRLPLRLASKHVPEMVEPMHGQALAGHVPAQVLPMTPTASHKQSPNASTEAQDKKEFEKSKAFGETSVSGQQAEESQDIDKGDWERDDALRFEIGQITSRLENQCHRHHVDRSASQVSKVDEGLSDLLHWPIAGCST